MSGMHKTDVGPSKHNGTETYDVFVGGLPDTATDRQVNTRYSAFGEIHSIALIKGKYPGTKVAFVRFFSKLDADKAVMETNGEIFDGKFIIVRRSRDQKNIREQSSEENNNRLSPGRGNWNMNKEHHPRSCTETNGSSAVKEHHPRSGTGTNGSSAVKEHHPRSGTGTNSSSAIKEHHPRSVTGANGSSAVKEHHPRSVTGTNGSSAAAPVMEERQVFVTQVEDVCTFWGQNMKVGEKIVQFSDELQGVCAAALPLTLPPKPRKLYGAKFSEDQQWYRCKVINMVSDNQALVQYVDYGNTETVQWQEIRMLPLDFASAPPYAECYRLTGMVPTAQDQTLGLGILQSLIENQAVQVKVRAKSEEGAMEADVTVDGVDISQSLVEKGFIVERPVKQSPAKPTPPTPDMKDRSMPMAKGDSGDVERLDQVQALRGKLTDMENRVKVFVQERHTLQDQMNKQHKVLELQVREIQEKEKKLADLQKVLQEKDAALLQLKTEIHEKDKLLENSISHQIQAVSAQVKKVQLSRKEMPVEQDVPDPIQQAIAMVTDKTQRVGAADVQSVMKVSVELGKLKNLQEQISACSEKDDTLTGLIAERNDARKYAQAAITECIEEMQSLPLRSRLSSLQDTVSGIEETYKKYVSSEGKIGGKASTETFQTFLEWRSHKSQSLQSLRRATNQHCKEVCQELEAVVKSLSSLMMGETGNDVDSAIPGTDLAELLSDFGQVMEQELTDSKVEEGGDVKLMTKVVNMLLNDLRGEIADIHKLQGLLARNMKCQEDMSRWITSQPDLEPLRLVKKEIRALKSEIRHKMADKQDLEEEDFTGAQLQQVECQLMDLREKIQDAFSREHQLMEEAATQANSNFPELPLLYPELNLATFMESGGLVKVGWELDHYNVAPVPLALTKGSASAMLTTFNHKPVVIKEYTVEGGEGSERSKKAILARAKEFHGFKHPSIIPVKAIFFSKMMRQMYVQMPYYLGSSLTELQDSNPLNNLETFLVLKGVLEGLYHLHTRGVSHGAVTPQYVLAPGRTQGMLDNYDFSKTPTQRAATPFQTPNGLSFVPPEVAKGQPASTASDMYQFGVLVLWMCCPADNFTSTDWGVPSLSNITLDVDLREFLPRLLQANSSARHTADRILQLKFFKEPPTAKAPLLSQPKSPVLPKSVQNLGSSSVKEVASTHHHDTVSTNQTGSSSTLTASKPVHSVLPLRTSPPTGSEAPRAIPGLPVSPQPQSPTVKDGPISLPRPLSPQVTAIPSVKSSPLINLANITAAIVKETEKITRSASGLEKEGADCNAGQQKSYAGAEEVPVSPSASKESLQQQHLDIMKAKGANVLIQYGVTSPDTAGLEATGKGSLPSSPTKQAEEPPVCGTTDLKPGAKPSDTVSNLPADSDTSVTSLDADQPAPAVNPTTSGFTTSMRASLEAAYESLGLLMSPTKQSSTSSQLSSSASTSITSCLGETADSPVTESTDLEASMAATSSPASMSPPPSPLRTTPEMVEQQSSPLTVGMGGLSSNLTESLPSSYLSPNGHLPATVADTGLDGPDHCD